MTNSILIVVLVMLGTTLAATAFLVARVVLHNNQQNQPPDIPAEAALEVLRASLKALELQTDASIERLTLAVAEGIDHVDRNEKRVRGIVTGAKRRFAAEGYVDAGVDAEFETLPESDVQASETQGMLPLHENMAPDGAAYAGTPWAAVPGIDRINRQE